MRVLHVDPERGFGGGEVQVLGLVRALAARGVAPTLALDPRGALAAKTSDLPTVALPIANHVDVRAGLALRRAAAGFDVVHFHTARAHALAPFCARRGARRVVTRRMDYVPTGGPYARFLYNRAVDVVIAISDGVRAALVSAGVRPERIRVVPSGVDLERVTAPADARATVRAAWGAGTDDVVVLALGALERRKGQAVLLEAAARLDDPRLRVVLVGAGSEETSLRGRAASMRGRAVVFAGFRDDVGACLAAADVVAMPSLQEGLGVAALEAMAAGRPVVASRVGGLAEAVVDDVTGRLVPVGDAAALAAVLGELARDPGRRAQLGAAGRARVLGRYTMAQMAKGTLACYGGPPCA